MQERLQRFGGWLAGMVIPNIGAFIAWGFITALIIDTGWLVKLGIFDVEQTSPLVDPLVGKVIVYLLPTLIAYTGGKMVHGHRGGVLAAIAVFGVIGSQGTLTAEVFDEATGLATGEETELTIQPPQFLGAMLMGPLAGWVMKKIDGFLEDRTPAGFEMLFNNFSQGFAGIGLVFLGYWIVGPIMAFIANVFGSAVTSLAEANLLPLADIPIEVAKVLFLNNAINHGVLTPLGTQDVFEGNGRSIYYMLESNPGPGLGLLGAYWFAGKGLAKLSAPGAIIVHFFGGIHEVYFPYVLMNPVMIVAMWAGGITADFVFLATDAGLTVPPSPGSIFAYIGGLPPEGGAAFGVIAGVAVGAVVSFITGSALLKMFPVKDMADTDIDEVGVGDAMPDIPGMSVPGASA